MTAGFKIKAVANSERDIFKERGCNNEMVYGNCTGKRQRFFDKGTGKFIDGC